MLQQVTRLYDFCSKIVAHSKIISVYAQRDPVECKSTSYNHVLLSKYMVVRCEPGAPITYQMSTILLSIRYIHPIHKTNRKLGTLGPVLP